MAQMGAHSRGLFCGEGRVATTHHPAVGEDHWRHAKTATGAAAEALAVKLGHSAARSRHGIGQRFTQATASSMSLTSQSQKPATSSLVSAKGPSMTMRRGPSKATRLP